MIHIDLGKRGSLRIGTTPLSKPYCGYFIYPGKLYLNIVAIWVFWFYISLIYKRETKTAAMFMKKFTTLWGTARVEGKDHANR